ncbi:mitofusin [Collariella sp. IMI 366227]|nr:mitofusin [Collariella sp. IMI 366227]
MSQEFFSPKGKGVPRYGGEGNGEGESENASSSSQSQSQSQSSAAAPVATSAAPGYMTVGNGSTSQYAAHLQAMLDHDSGYGGSIADDQVSSSMFDPSAAAAWDTAIHPDRPIRTQASSSSSHADHRSQASAVHQLWYNQHRATLGRTISTVTELLRELQEKNTTWPAHYPSVQRAALDAPSRPASRPGIHQAYSIAGDLASTPSSSSFPPPNPPLRRAMTSLEDIEPESSKAAEIRTPAEPRLVTPQIAQEFSVLKLDLKLGTLHQSELVHSLEKGSIASLLDGKIQSSIRHLQALRERIEDTSSKVLVTGDLNAGKSTFCNALLRRKILPEDQQPCTSIFCEVLDARENCGIEEVHAVRINAVYDRHDETTYDVFSLRDLERIVVDNEVYMQCKVYVKDVRTIDESLLNNGVVDIALIDAPGLNMDTTKTTAIFARQEEIDVVVFVVSASNHFTQTSTEFIRAAAAEKAYLFIVVNGYDAIRDKDRCQKLILNQVQALSPATFKESAELVHFVSSTAIPMAPAPPGGPGGGGSGSASGGGFDDPNDDDPKGKKKEMERDFSALEQSLRRFVLEKRARSKLAPAKTYLMNILNDVNVLATVNAEVAQGEFDRVNKELQELEPQLESSKRARGEISDKIDQTIEETCKDVYEYSRSTINSAIAHSGEGNLGIRYPGLFSAFQYADELKEAMLSQIAASVVHCEEHARTKTVGGVNMIKQLGILHLGNEYENLNFKSDVMFQHKKHALARQVDIPTEFWDFVDWSTMLQKEEKAGMALTVAGVAGTGVVSSYGQMNIALRVAQMLGSDNLRRLIVPGAIAAVAAMAFYVLSQIPRSLPHRLSVKISTQLVAMDYVHSNSHRISGTVRKVLLIPANSLRVGLQRSVEQLDLRRDETLKVRKESNDALRYFGNLVQRSAHQRRQIETVDLDAHPPGAQGFH